MVNLYEHQKKALALTDNNNKCAYYLDMGLGKTFVGSEKMCQFTSAINLVICQKSKIQDWIDHFKKYYTMDDIIDLTDKKQFELFCNLAKLKMLPPQYKMVGVINYELAFRRKILLSLSDFTLMLDESSLIQNETAKRSKFIMKLDFKNLILLSGTPTGGRYEKLWSQLHMLGYPLSKKAFYNMYVNYHYDDKEGFPVMIIDGYKNVERLKRKMTDLGCVFMKSEEVFDLPKQNFIDLKVNTTREYRKFRKDCICMVDNEDIVGDTILTKMLYERQLCGQYNKEKLTAFKDLVESTNDRLIVFYNFTEELNRMQHVLLDIDYEDYSHRFSIVNGEIKSLKNYESVENSITFIQYQAGAMGLNLQKANKIVYFTPPLSSELFEQSKKRIHRIGQNKPCFYYKLICRSSIEEKIYKTLNMRRDYTDKLFERDVKYE